MSLEYKHLSNGYHFVCDTAAHHRFAQWPIGTELTAEHVSHNGLSDREVGDFVVRVRKFVAKITGLHERLDMLDTSQ